MTAPKGVKSTHAGSSKGKGKSAGTKGKASRASSMPSSPVIQKDARELQSELVGLKETLNSEMGALGTKYWYAFVQFTVGRATKPELDRVALECLPGEKGELDRL